MALIEWSNSFSVKNTVIDNQHQKLFDYLNELSDAMATGKSNEVIDKILDSLISYTATHFKYEEDLFEKYSYPNVDSHIKTHTEFVNKVIQFKQDFKSGKALLSVKIMRFLTDWLMQHINGTDKMYIEFFESKGINK